MDDITPPKDTGKGTLMESLGFQREELRAWVATQAALWNQVSLCWAERAGVHGMVFHCWDKLGLLSSMGPETAASKGTQCPVIWEGKEIEAEPTVLNVHPKGSFSSFLLSFMQKPCQLKNLCYIIFYLSSKIKIQHNKIKPLKMILHNGGCGEVVSLNKLLIALESSRVILKNFVSLLSNSSQNTS